MCPDKQIISAYADGEVKSKWSSSIEMHLEICPECESFYKSIMKTRKILNAGKISTDADQATVLLNINRKCSTQAVPTKRNQPGVLFRPILAFSAAAAIFGIFFAFTGIFRITDTGSNVAQASSPMTMNFNIDSVNTDMTSVVAESNAEKLLAPGETPEDTDDQVKEIEPLNDGQMRVVDFRK